LYFVNSNSSTNGASEVLSNLRGYVGRYQEACLEGGLCGGDFPTKGCEGNLLLIFEEDSSLESRVYQNQSCVYIVGDTVKSADAFLYKVLKVT